MVGEGGSFENYLRLIGRVPETRIGITEATIRELKFGCERQRWSEVGVLPVD